MRRLIFYPACMLMIVVALFTSCKKDAVSTTNSSTTLSKTPTGTLVLGTVTTATTSGTTTTDTVVAVNCFGRHSQPDSVAFSALPTAISTYLTTNYAGYTAGKAFKIDSASVTTGYIVVIKYNTNFVALKFTASGTFVAALEQRDKADINGRGFHEGGPFDDRDGRHKDTVAISALPSTITAAFTKAYPSDTLLHAAVTPDSTYILISKNKGLYTTAISKTGTVLRHVAMPNPPAGHCVIASVAQTSLPSNVLTYLTTTYPSYVFNAAFKISVNDALKGYAVFITSNSTRYVVNFDNSGNFVSTITVH